MFLPIAFIGTSQNSAGCHKNINKPNVAFCSNFWRFLDGDGGWHSKVTMFTKDMWQAVNKHQLRQIFIDDGRAVINMAEKTHAILVNLLSSEDSDTLEDPGVVVIRVTPPLIPSVCVNTRQSVRSPRTETTSRNMNQCMTW